MTTPEPLAVGDTVKVFDINADRRSMPEDGWDGTVTKIGTKFIYIIHPWSQGVSEKFTHAGRAADGYGHRSFLTLAAAELAVRRKRALAYLLEHADLVPRRDPDHAPLEVLEAAADGILGYFNPLQHVAADEPISYDPMSED